jgi:YD repeat-containing protein
MFATPKKLLLTLALSIWGIHSPLAQAAECACGKEEAFVKFKISSKKEHSSDKATVSDYPTGEDGPKNKLPAPDWEATYDDPAEFWMVGAPHYPIYTITVTTSDPARLVTPGKTIYVSLPCGVEYRFPDAVGASDDPNSSEDPSKSWITASQVPVYFPDGQTSPTTATFEVRIKGKDDAEAGDAPEVEAIPEMPHDTAYNQDTANDRGFAVKFPLGLLDPAGDLETRRSAGQLILSSPADITGILNMDNFKVYGSSALGDLPPPSSPDGHVYEDLPARTSTFRRYISPSSIIEVNLDNMSGKITVKTFENDNGTKQTPHFAETELSMSNTATIPGMDNPLIITTGTEITQVATNTSSAPSNVPTASSIKKGNRRTEKRVNVLSVTPHENEVVESEYIDLPGGGEVCVRMTVSVYTYIGGRAYLTYRSQDLNGDPSQSEGLETTWDYYTTGANEGLVKTMENSEDGSWAAYGYYGDSTVVYRPFLSTALPANINTVLATFNSSGTANSIDGTRRVVTISDWPKMTFEQRRTMTYITQGGNDRLVDDGIARALNEVITDDPGISVGRNKKSATWTKTLRGTAQPNGTVFSEVAGANDVASHWETRTYTGTYNFAGAGGVSLAGFPANFQVHANLSTCQVSVRDEFGVIRTSTEIFNGTSFVEATYTEYQYDGEGRQTHVYTDGVLVSKYTYVSDWVTEHEDRKGTKTTTTYNLAGDLVSTVRGEGTGGTPVITTTYERNGLTTSTYQNGVLVNSTTVDLAGRVVSQTDALGNITTTGHVSLPGGGKRVHTTLLGGLENEIDTHRDGSTISMTSDTLISSHYTYSVDEIDSGSGVYALVTTVSPESPTGSRYTKSYRHPSFDQTVTVSPNLEDGATGEVFTVQNFDHTNLISSTQSYVGSIDGSVELGGSVSHPGRDVNGLTAAGAMGMSTISGKHADGPVTFLSSSDINHQHHTLTKMDYVQVAHPGGGTVWAQRTTTTRTLVELDENDVQQTSSDQTVSYASLNQANGDFQKVEANGEVIESTTTYNLVTEEVITTQTSQNSGTSTSTSVAGYLVSSQPAVSDGRSASYGYDARGRQIRSVDVRGRATNTIYNAAGQVTSTQDHNGEITIYEYYPANTWEAGRLKKMTDPLGRTTTYTYNHRGQVLTVGGTAQYPLTYTYTAEGEVDTLTTTTQQGASVTRWTYHPERAGLVLAKTYDHGGTPETRTFEYHPFGQLSVASGAGGTKEYFITVLGDLGAEYSGSLDRIFYTRNSYGQVNKVIQRLRNPQFGNDYRNITYYNLHDANGKLVSESRGEMFDGYSGTQNASSDLKPFPSRVRYTLDPDNKLRNESYEIDAQLPSPVPGTWETIGGTTLGYDAKGRMNSVASNSHDTLATNPANLTHSYVHTANSAIPVSIMTNDGTQNIFQHVSVVNRRNEVLDVASRSIQGGSLAVRTSVGYHYDKVSQRTRAAREDGTYWKYGYNTRGEVTSAKSHQQGVGVRGGLQFEYDYDNIGNRKTMKYGGDENGANLETVQYTVNKKNQYTNLNHPGVHYITGFAGLTGSTPNSVEINNTAATAQEAFFFAKLTESNSANPLFVPIELEETPSGGSPTTTTLGEVFVPEDDVAPQYSNGNLINDGRWIYTWNGDDRLTRMQPTPEATAAYAAAGNTDPLPTLSFLYDWSGRRICKMVTKGTTETNTTYIYEGWNIVATLTQVSFSDITIVRPIWGTDLSTSLQGAGGVGGLLATRTTTRYYNWFDPAGVVKTEIARHLPSYTAAHQDL